MLRVHHVALLLATTGVFGGAHALAPRPAVDVASLTYDADVIVHPDSAWLAVRATLRYTVPDSGIQSLGLLLNRDLTISALDGALVRGFRVQPSEFSPTWNLITVDVAESVSAGRVVEMTIVYQGRPVMPGDGINRISPAWVELSLDSQWFPIVSTFAEAIVGDVRVTLPPAWIIVGSGVTSSAGGVQIIRNRVPQIDVAWSAAPVVQRAQRARVEVYHRTAPDSTVRAVLEAAAYCVRQLDTRFGVRDTFPVARVVLAERDGPGYARKNYIVLSTVQSGQAEATHQFLCHEVAHFWTRSPGSFSPDHWMSEAFAEYAAAMIVRERFGVEAFERLRARWEDGGRAHGPVWTLTSTRRPSFQVMYRRVPWLLAQLEARIGPERFARFLTRYMVEGAVTTPQLLEILSVTGGEDAAGWFRRALEQSPPPG